MLKFKKLIAEAVLVKQSRAIKIATKIWAYKRMIQALADRDNKAKQSNQVSKPAASRSVMFGCRETPKERGKADTQDFTFS